MSQNSSDWRGYLRKVRRHEGAVIAECERCGAKRLIETKIKPDLLEGICPECQTESVLDRPLWPSERSPGAHPDESQQALTFRAPTKLEMETMTPDEKLSRWVAEFHE